MVINIKYLVMEKPKNFWIKQKLCIMVLFVTLFPTVKSSLILEDANNVSPDIMSMNIEGVKNVITNFGILLTVQIELLLLFPIPLFLQIQKPLLALLLLPKTLNKPHGITLSITRV